MLAPPLFFFWSTMPALYAASLNASYWRGFMSEADHAVVAMPRHFHRSHPLAAHTGRGEIVAWPIRLKVGGVGR